MNGKDGTGATSSRTCDYCCKNGFKSLKYETSCGRCLRNRIIQLYRITGDKTPHWLKEKLRPN